MNNINIFKHYELNDILKSLIVFLIITVFPIITSVLMFTQIILLNLPAHMLLLTLLSGVIVFILWFGSTLFTYTLKQYTYIIELDYKKVMYILFISTSVIAISLVYIIGLNLI